MEDAVEALKMAFGALIFVIAVTVSFMVMAQAKATAENYRTTIRNIRRDGNEDLKKQQKAGEITEDQLKADTDKLQKLTDKYIEEINTVFAAKEKEIME